MAAIAAATKAAGTKREAIEAEAAVAATDDEGLGGTGAPTDGQVAGEYNVEIEYGDTSIVVEGATADDNETFMEAMDFGDGRTMHTRTHDADADGNQMVEVAIVSTDIEAPKPVPFAMWESNLAGDTPQAFDVSTDDDAADFEALGIDSDNIGMVKASEFAAPAGTVGTTILSFQHMVEDDTSTTDVDESRDAAEIMGTFNDTPGVYRCNAAAACTATVNTMGVVSAVSNNNDWIFIPAEGATTDQPDYDYLHYGFWLQRTTDSDGAITYDEVQTFAGSSVAATSSVASVTGRATYEGGAVGVYVRETYDEMDGSVDTATSGHFTADVVLNAVFGQVPVSDTDSTGTIAPNLLNTLTGTINDFELSNGEANTWSVNLQGSIDTGAATVTSTDGATGGGDPAAWSATFYGPNTMPDGQGGTTPTAPHTVVGEFNANFGNGLVAGGFGARKD